MIESERVQSEHVKRVVDLLEAKWSVEMLCALCEGPRRLSQLKRLIPAASKKGLTAGLRSLERGNVVVRRDLSNSVLHVEYELSAPMRAAVISLLEYLSRWSVSNLVRDPLALTPASQSELPCDSNHHLGHTASHICTPH